MNFENRQLHLLLFAGVVVSVTSSDSQAERMLSDFDRVCGSIGLQSNPARKMSRRACDVALFPSWDKIFEPFSHMYVQKSSWLTLPTREKRNRMQTTSGASKRVEEVVTKRMNVRLQVHLGVSNVLPVLVYVSRT